MTLAIIGAVLYIASIVTHSSTEEFQGTRVKKPCGPLCASDFYDTGFAGVELVRTHHFLGCPNGKKWWKR